MKFMRRSWRICSLSVLFTSTCFAGSSNQVEAENLARVLKARNSAQLARHLEAQHAVARDSLVCDAELRTGNLPIACFRILSFKKEVATGELPSFEWLLQLCKERAAKSKNWKEFEAAEHQSPLPDSCRKIARERAADLRYADETEHPADLFGRLIQPEADGPAPRTRK